MDANFSAPPPDYKAPPPPVPSRAGRGTLPSQRGGPSRAEGHLSPANRRAVRLSKEVVGNILASGGQSSQVVANVPRSHIPSPSLQLGEPWEQAVKQITSSGLKQQVKVSKDSLAIKDFDVMSSGKKLPELTDAKQKVETFKQTLKAWTDDFKAHFDPQKASPLSDKIPLSKHIEFFHAVNEVASNLVDSADQIRDLVKMVPSEDASKTKKMFAGGARLAKAKAALENDTNKFTMQASALLQSLAPYAKALGQAIDNKFQPLNPDEVSNHLAMNENAANTFSLTTKTYDAPYSKAKETPPPSEASLVPIEERGKTSLNDLTANNETVIPSNVVLQNGQNQLTIGQVSLQNVGKTGTNEDRVDCRTLNVNGRHIPYMAVMDGHGGPQVADLLKEKFATKFQTTLANLAKLDDHAIYNAIDQACAEFNQEIRDKTPPISAGACAAFTLIIDNGLWVANVGDTRAVLVDGSHVRNLSEDMDLNNAHHAQKAISLGGEIMQGNWGPTDLRLKGDRGVGRLQCPGSFGDCTTAGVSARPFINKVNLDTCSAGTYVVMGCDGLWDTANSEEVASVVRDKNNQSPAEIAGSLAWKAANGSVDFANGLPRYDDGSERHGMLKDVPGTDRKPNVPNDDITVVVIPLK